MTWLGCPVLPFTGWGGGVGESGHSRLAQEAGIIVHTSMCCLEDKLRNCVWKLHKLMEDRREY